MKNISLKNIESFQVRDETNNHTYYGFNQEWYRKKWQRLSGCGPTAVANILYYLGRTFSIPGLDRPVSRERSPDFLDQIWRYVTPTIRGIPSTQLLCQRVQSLAEAKLSNLRTQAFNIPSGKQERPEFHELLSFLSSALSENSPVAFLNLHNGSEKALDSWHWVTIVAIEYEESGTAAFLNILDEGLQKRINLAQWFLTTEKGGGFVRFSFSH